MTCLVSSNLWKLFANSYQHGPWSHQPVRQGSAGLAQVHGEVAKCSDLEAVRSTPRVLKVGLPSESSRATGNGGSLTKMACILRYNLVSKGTPMNCSKHCTEKAGTCGLAPGSRTLPTTSDSKYVAVVQVTPDIMVGMLSNMELCTPSGPTIQIR